LRSCRGSRCDGGAAAVACRRVQSAAAKETAVPKVAALYRYPLKGFTPESRESLQVLADGRVAGDRVLGLRYADNEAGDDEWSPKTGMLVLMTTPGLARLNVRYDEATRRLRVEHDGALLVEDGIDGEGRQRIAEAVEAFAATLEP